MNLAFETVSELRSVLETILASIKTMKD